MGDTLERCDTRVKVIKSDSDSDSDEQKKSPGFSGKNGGETPSVTATGVTHPSDTTESDESRPGVGDSSEKKVA